jgi:putative ATP-binding cassette transporter
VLFLDEATSALDAETEKELYELVIQELPEAAIISIAHRASVASYHTRHWRFEPVEQSEIQTTDNEQKQYRVVTAEKAKTNSKKS